MTLLGFNKKNILYFIIIIFFLNINIRAGSIKFISPEAPNQVSQEIIKNCPISIPIYFNTLGKNVNTIDFKIIKNNYYQLNNFDHKNGKFQSYTKPIPSKTRHKSFPKQQTLYILGSTLSKQGINGTGLFGILDITAIQTGNFELKIYYHPKAIDDTNMYIYSGKKIQDTLTQTNSIKFTVKDGICGNKKKSNKKKKKENKTNKNKSEKENLPVSVDNLLENIKKTISINTGKQIDYQPNLINENDKEKIKFKMINKNKNIKKKEKITFGKKIKIGVQTFRERLVNQFQKI